MNDRAFLVRLAATVTVVLGGYWLVAAAMAHWRVPEALLAGNNEQAAVAISLAVVFLLLRFFVFFCLPGWVAARILLHVQERRLRSETGQNEAVR